MSENNEKQVQAQEAAEPEIHLTLTPQELEEENAKQLEALEAKQAAAEAKSVTDPISESKLTEAEKKTVNEFSKKIDIPTQPCRTSVPRTLAKSETF